MKSPTSLIRFRNAVGVMLALSAIFAVVLSTISLPSDDADAQQVDENNAAVLARAKAWWDSLDNEQKVNALRGYEADHDATASGRQLGNPARTNTDPDSFYDEDGNEVDTADDGDAGVPLTEVETAQRMFEEFPVLSTDSGTIVALVNGNSSGGDIYAVGEHFGDIAKALRGFQSVPQWWAYVDCAEARRAVGEDNNAIATTAFDDPYTTEVETIPEPSAVCEVVDVDGAATVQVKAYSSLGDAKDLVDKVGQAILGLDAPGSLMTADNARAKAWWDLLSATERAQALYGDGVTVTVPTAPDTGDATVTANRGAIASQDYDDIKMSLTFTVPVDGEDTALPLNDDSKALVDGVKALINDRWQWIYNDRGGENTDGRAEVIHWWDSTDCAMMRTIVGEDNERSATIPSATAFCAPWDNIAEQLTKVQQARILELGQAILGISPAVPDVAAWWNTLNEDQMVYVVYGDPPMRTAYDDPDDDPDAGETVTTVTAVDKAVFQKMYDGLTGGINVEASGTALSTHLPERITAMLARNGFSIDTPTAVDTDDDDTDDMWYYSAKGIVDAIANEIFDPPTPVMDPYGGLMADGTGTAAVITDDGDFDWPYRTDNGPATVADWWEQTDCRVMRIAVGEDNNYLNSVVAAVEDDPGTADTDETMAAIPAETSIYCGHFPGAPNAAEDGSNVLSAMAQERVVEVGAALLGLSVSSNDVHANRPSFNEPPDPNKVPTISGTAQVGSVLTADTTPISDTDGVGTFNYQWLSDGADIPGATQKTYTLQPSDIGKAISVRVSYVDGERYPEMITSNASSTIAGSPGEVSRIEPGIRGVTVSAGDTVTLSVDIYGLQNVKDNTIGASFSWSQQSGSNTPEELDGSDRKISFTAPSSPGTYTVTASLDSGQCQPDDEADRDADCEASITVQVRRASAPVPVDPEPQNPPGDIPGLIPDSDGNQYEVFTPVEGGTFDGGEGYSISVPSGAVPNGEYIGIRMSDDGAASNLGMTHQRYTLAGNMYGVHAVDASGAAISSYVLEDPAEVCVPLPASLRTNLSTLSLAAINSDGSLTILAAQAKLNSNGDTMVCGNLSNLPATVAVGAQGAPDAIPTATPVPEPELPDTGGTSPASGGLVWVLLLGTAAVVSGTFIVIGRRRKTVRSK